MFIQRRPRKTSIISAANLPSVLGKTKHTTASLPLFILVLGPAKLSMCVMCLQGAHGGFSTASNLTHSVSRDQDGLALTCEAFHPGTRFSQSVTESLTVFCK